MHSTLHPKKALTNNFYFHFYMQKLCTTSHFDSIYTGLCLPGYLPRCHLASQSKEPTPNKPEGGSDLPNRAQNLGFHSPICYFRPGARVKNAHQHACHLQQHGLLLLMLQSWGRWGLLLRNSGLTLTSLCKWWEGTLQDNEIDELLSPAYAHVQKEIKSWHQPAPWS